MPTFDYCCSDCGRKVEKFEPMSAPAQQPCECGGTLKRQFGAGAGVLWKGGAPTPQFSRRR